MQQVMRSSPAGILSLIRNMISPFLPLALLPMVVLIAIAAVFVWVSFQTGVIGTEDAEYSLENYQIVFGDPFVYEVLENTLIFALATTVVSLVVGLPIAWITERTTIRPKELIYAMMTTGLLVPPIFIGMGWTFIAHQRIGLINKLMAALKIPKAFLGYEEGVGSKATLAAEDVRFSRTIERLRNYFK